MRRSVLRSAGIPLGVLALGLLLTALAAVAVHREARSVDARHLRNTATRNNAVLADGIREYENVLLSAGSLIGSTALPTPTEWREYVSALQIDTRYPGLRGIGYIAAVPAEDLDAYIQRTRQLIPDFAMRRLPDGPPNVRDYFPITYIEPIERNQGARGLDIGSEVNRRAAAEEARDTGRPTLTRRITLVQDDQQRAGALLLVPLYRRGMPVGTVAERRAAHFGWLYAPLIADEVIAGLDAQLSDEVNLFLSETEGARQTTIVGATDTQHDHVSTSLMLGGRTFTATWSATPTFQRERDYTNRVLSLGLAVTALLTMLVYRQQAAAREATALAAENSELFEAAPAALLIIDERGTVLRANTTAEATFAASDDALTGRNVSELAALPAGAHDAYMRHYINTGTAATAEGLVIGRTREVPARRVDGKPFPAELMVTETSRGVDGKRHFLGVIVDLTERQAAEARMTQAQKHEALGRLVAGIAHDFNNLLAVISGGIGLARLDPQQQDRWLGNAATAADRAAALVRQLTQFSRRGTRGDEVVPIGEVAIETISLIRETFDRRLLVESVIEPILPAVQGDRSQLQQAVMNLLINARDAVTERLEGDSTGAYVPSIRLEVARARDGAPGAPAQVAVTVRDNGVGITEADQDRVFDPFFTTKGPDRGTGLGLATTYAVVSEHGGTIEVTSQPGHGATFVMRLPAIAAPPRAAAPSAPTPVQGSQPGRRAAVLVVDDEPLLGEIASAVLEEAGYDISVVTSGRSAIDMCAGRHFDVCLLDANMPRPDGWETLAELRAAHPELYVIMTSGDRSAEMSLARGADAFLQKPYNASALTNAVAAALPAAAGRAGSTPAES